MTLQKLVENKSKGACFHAESFGSCISFLSKSVFQCEFIEECLYYRQELRNEIEGMESPDSLRRCPGALGSDNACSYRRSAVL